MRPLQPFQQTVFGHTPDINKVHSREPGHVTRRLYTRHIRKFQKALRGYPKAEAPFFRIIGLETGKILAANRIPLNIARVSVRPGDCSGKLAAPLFYLCRIHSSHVIAQKDPA